MQYKNYKDIIEFIGEKWVILIEPSANYRISIKQFFTNMKVNRVKHFNTPDEAKAFVNEKNSAVIVSEWNLPKINGLQLCRELRKQKTTATIPFLLMSVENNRSDVILASEVGIDAYLLKPFSFDEFYEQIQNLTSIKQKTAPENPILTNAEQLMKKKNFAEAEPLFINALQLKPDSARARLGLAKIEVNKNNNEYALKLLEEACKLNIQYLEAFKEKLYLFELGNDLEGQLRTLLELQHLSPENPVYTLKMANVYLHKKDFKNSELYFKKTITLSPKLAGGHKGLGDVYMFQNDNDRAIKHYQKALDLDASDVSVLNSIGLTYIKLGNFAEGLKKYFLALEIDPCHPSILFNIGYAYEKKEEYEKAIEFFQKALLHCSSYEKAKKHTEFCREQIKK